MTPTRIFCCSRPLFLGALSVLTACGGEACPVSETWTAPDYAANTVEAIALREQLNTLTTGMRSVEEGTATLDPAAIDAAYEAGSPSLLDVTSPQYQTIVADAFAEFVEVAQTGPVDLVDATGAWTPGANGGIFGSSSRGINEGGLEVRQIVDKGLFAGAGFYRYATQLSAGDVQPATVESINAVFGGTADLSTTDLTDSANYANTMDFYDHAADHLAEAHGHAGDETCAMERDEALAVVFEEWELAMFARFVFYANVAHEAVAAGITDESVATAIHELSEGLGLALGFYGLDVARVVTDAQIERMMTALGVNLGNLGASTTGELLVDPTAYEAGVREVEAAVAEAFGLTTAEVEAFRVESVTE